MGPEGGREGRIGGDGDNGVLRGTYTLLYIWEKERNIFGANSEIGQTRHDFPS